MRSALIEQARKRAPRFDVGDNFFEKSEVEYCERYIDLIRKSVPLQWNTEPENADLYNWRKLIKPLRDEILAHPGNTVNVIRPNADQIRHGYDLIAKLVSAAHHVFIGVPLPKNTMRQLTKSANQFWDYAQIGFIQAFEGQQEKEQQALDRLKTHSRS